MPHLFRHLRVHQVFGANTDVGKTILTTALCRASSQGDAPVYYLKPVSTGPANEADDSHLKRFSGRVVGQASPSITTSCLFKFDEPVSPHLAVRMKGLSKESIPTDSQFTSAISRHIHDVANRVPSSANSSMYIETAGGVHSPTPSGTSQARAYRPLRLPTILVGDSKLGGISSTISAYESLLIQGYDVESLVVFWDNYYRNWEYLTEWFSKRNEESTVGSKVKVSVVPPPPLRKEDPAEDATALLEYYQTLDRDGPLAETLDHLKSCHEERIAAMESMKSRTFDQIWWPFVQHGMVKDPQEVTVIDSALGDHFSATPAGSSRSSSFLEPLYDGSSSWWTQSLGHANYNLTLAAAYASGRYGHVMFPMATHQPALSLAERLINDGPGKGWASRAFFSDNGSTGTEVALKMALRAAGQRFKNTKKLEVIGLKGSYHGDTIGAMDACEDGVYNSRVEWYDGRGYWFDVPTIGFKSGRLAITTPLEWGKEAVWLFDSIHDAYDVPARLETPVAKTYKKRIEETLTHLTAKASHKFAALIIEPLVMGAGGMIFVDPLFQRILIDVVRDNEHLFSGLAENERKAPPGSWKGLPIIFDEVFTGLYRLGSQTAADILKVQPDISVYAKILTGGLLPLSVTLASSSIFDAFTSDSKVDALLHGHSYTAHPIGCAVANESLKMINTLTRGDAWTSAQTRWKEQKTTDPIAWSFWDPWFVRTLSNHPKVEESMALGTVLAFKLRTTDGGYSSTLAQTAMAPLRVASKHSNAIHYRTLGDVAYFMASLNTPDETFRALETRILSVLEQ